VRILSRKIWRAFPELDQYDDETCKKYVNSAHAMSGRLLRTSFVLSAAFIGFGLAIVISEPERRFLGRVLSWVFTDIRFDGLVGSSIFAVTISNIIWMPWLAGAMVRDFMLERCLKKKLMKAGCPKCSYNLLGLEILQHNLQKVVRCPECGKIVVLNTGHISEQDIDPILIDKT